MPTRDTRPPSRFRLSRFFSSAEPLTMTNEPGSPHIQSPVKITTLLDSSVGSNPKSIDETDKSQRLSLRKARKLSRVFAEFSLLDSFAERKSVDDLRVPRSKPKSTSLRPATAHGQTHSPSLGGRSTNSLDGKPPRPTSPTAPPPQSMTPITTLSMPISKSKSSNAPQSPIRLNALLTPQIQPSSATLSPENTPLPSSRPNSSHGPAIVKKSRRSLDLKQLDERFNSRTPLSSRSRSLRIMPVLDLSRPTTPKAPDTLPDLLPDTRDPPASPEAARQHYVEVKRARKMTQLFGHELPPDLIRVLDERRRPEPTRRRADSTGSATPDSIPSTPTVEKITNAPEEENVTPPSTPTKPRVEFQERRRRVAKLSQFFGVDHAEIASSLAFTKQVNHCSNSVDDERQKPASGSYAEPIEVGVKMVSRRRWGLGEDMRDVELGDAINKLRCLKAN